MSDALPPLKAGDAAAAIIVLENGHYLLQHRDAFPEIWFPDHWGCFGGAIDPGETAEQAMKRELREELGIEVGDVEFVTHLEFDLGYLGSKLCRRDYFLLRLTDAQYAACALTEGQAMAAFDVDTMLTSLRLTPYDAFVLFLYGNRHRIS